MKKRRIPVIVAVLSMSITTMAGTAPAAGDGHENFNRISTFSVYTNNTDAGEETVAEIVAATDDGNTLVYTDGAGEQIGFVDISDPTSPTAAGVVSVGGEPTSVDVYGAYAVVGVNTSESFVAPSGELAVIDIARRSAVTTIPLAGQPDSMKVSPSGNFLTIVIENERDEDIEVGGVEGGLPQLPAGLLQIIELNADPTTWSTTDIALDGLGLGYEPTDPEPEFVDINPSDIAAVSLQENNTVAIVDLTTGDVTGFDAGTVDLAGVDTIEEDVISLTGSLADVPREPDALAWIGTDRVATANEGDLFGGSRGFTIFDSDGTVVFDSGVEFEYLAVRNGHYPEGRSENKGSEPEAIEYGVYGDSEYLFVGSERGSFVGVYQLIDGVPVNTQILPAPLGPEGMLAIPDRDLLVVSGEDDDPSFGVRATIQIYELQGAPATYPQIASSDLGGAPIPWSALSALAAHPTDPNTLYAVWDSFYANSVIFTIDVSSTPAVITNALPITGASDLLDPEGLAIAADGGFWLASEGGVSVDSGDPANDPGSSTPNLLVRIASDGSVIDEIGLPDEVVACREATVGDQSASRGERRDVRFGFEGVTEAANGVVFVAQQREWLFTTPDCADLSGQPGVTKIWSYNPTDGEWDSFEFELLPKPANASWVGLSEITALDDGSFMVIERDNRTGDFAEIKMLQRIEIKSRGANAVTRISGYDLLPDMLATNGWISDKPEGAAVAADGTVYVVTDNDGVDDWSGETLFLDLGSLDTVLQPGDTPSTPPSLVPPTSPPGQGCAPGCGKGNGGDPPGLAKWGGDLPPGLARRFAQ